MVQSGVFLNPYIFSDVRHYKKNKEKPNLNSVEISKPNYYEGIFYFKMFHFLKSLIRYIQFRTSGNSVNVEWKNETKFKETSIIFHVVQKVKIMWKSEKLKFLNIF